MCFCTYNVADSCILQPRSSPAPRVWANEMKWWQLPHRRSLCCGRPACHWSTVPEQLQCFTLCAAPPTLLHCAELQLLSAEERLEALQAAGLTAAQVEDVETMLSGAGKQRWRELLCVS